jgi:RES domain
MPNVAVPSRPPDDPARVSLPKGTRLSRVHASRFGATEFNPTLADPHWGGGRFDATEAAPYEYLYAGSDDECAVCEALLRDLPLDAHGGRFLLRRAVADLVLSRLTVTSPVDLVRLCTGDDLARIGQGDSWLISCPSAEYGFTRRWAHALRAWAPWAVGFVWPSRRDLSKRAYILFGDRLGASLAATESTEDDPMPARSLRFDSVPGEELLLAILAKYRVTLAP